MKVDLRKALTQKDVSRALEELLGATKIVFNAGLPPHDPVRMELDNVEDLSGTQAAKEVIDPAMACLWACGKKFLAGNLLSDHLGMSAFLQENYLSDETSSALCQAVTKYVLPIIIAQIRGARPPKTCSVICGFDRLINMC